MDASGVTLAGWLLLQLGAAWAGFSKTAVGGAATVAVVLFAVALPARASTGVLLLVLVCGDLIATWTYRRDVDWRLIGRLLPPVVLGLFCGAFVLGRVDDGVMRRAIGVVLLVLAALGALTRARPPAPSRHASLAPAVGAVAGMTTMLANAGGPVMSLYLLTSRVSMTRFLGTFSWFFFAVNLAKLPFSVAVGVLTPEAAALAATLLPGLLVGAWCGRALVTRLDQAWFERLVLVFVAASALYLVLV